MWDSTSRTMLLRAPNARRLDRLLTSWHSSLGQSRLKDVGIFRWFTLNECRQTHEPLSIPKLCSPLIMDLIAVRAWENVKRLVGSNAST